MTIALPQSAFQGSSVATPQIVIKALPDTYDDLLNLVQAYYGQDKPITRGGIIAWVRHARSNYDDLIKGAYFADYLCWKHKFGRAIDQRLQRQYGL